jgi:hypothetical protein
MEAILITAQVITFRSIRNTATTSLIFVTTAGIVIIILTHVAIIIATDRLIIAVALDGPAGAVSLLPIRLIFEEVQRSSRAGQVPDEVISRD